MNDAHPHRWYHCPLCGRLALSPGPVIHGGSTHDFLPMLPYVGAPPGPPHALDELEARVDELEPWLRRFYQGVEAMLIPSVLAAVDETLWRLEWHRGPGEDRARALAGRLRGARAAFRPKG